MPITRTLGSRRSSRLAASIAASAAALVLSLGLMSGTAHASGGFAGHLPPKTWTTNGAFDNSLSKMIFEIKSGPASDCVGPAEYNGTWSFPYGWFCNNKTLWIAEFGPIAAYPAVDNPNSQEIYFGVTYYG